MRYFFLALALLTFADFSQAGPIRNRRQAKSIATNSFAANGFSSSGYGYSIATASMTASDALQEVNAARAARGLPPYLEDPGLTAAAMACAQVRAMHRIAGHINDFAYLPAGSYAGAAGCGAMDASWGVQVCDKFANWRYAGVASVMGSDGKMYHHAFYRN